MNKTVVNIIENGKENPHISEWNEKMFLFLKDRVALVAPVEIVSKLNDCILLKLFIP